MEEHFAYEICRKDISPGEHLDIVFPDGATMGQRAGCLHPASLHFIRPVSVSPEPPPSGLNLQDHRLLQKDTECSDVALAHSCSAGAPGGLSPLL